MTPPPPTLQELIDTVRQDSGSEEALDQLVTASAAVSQLEETSDALLGHFVDRCRRSGHSWSEISQALGVTKQAVHKRFAVAADHLIASTPAPALERFTMRARNVLAAALRSAEPGLAGGEHLLIGLFAEPDGLAAQALTASGVTVAAVQRAVGTGLADPGTGPAPQLSGAEAARRFTEDGRHLLRDAVAVALELGHNYIGTEHLLLAMYRHHDSPAARILRSAGASEADITAWLKAALAGLSAGK